MTHGMVCAPQPEAVEAGALALRNGGNGSPGRVGGGHGDGPGADPGAGRCGFLRLISRTFGIRRHAAGFP